VTKKAWSPQQQRIWVFLFERFIATAMAAIALAVVALALVCPMRVAGVEVEVGATGSVMVPTMAEHAVAKNVYGRGLVREKFEAEAVVEHHQRFHKAVVRKFNGESLVYVTPWNNHGYDTAKVFAGALCGVGNLPIAAARTRSVAAARCRRFLFKRLLRV
jgi:hypothetical protein